MGCLIVSDKRMGVRVWGRVGKRRGESENEIAKEKEKRLYGKALTSKTIIKLKSFKSNKLTKHKVLAVDTIKELVKLNTWLVYTLLIYNELI